MARTRHAGLLALVSASLLVAASAAAATSASAAATGLVAAYSFDSVSGGLAADDSGTGNTASVSGAVPVTGRFGRGLAFDGVDDLVTVADSASLDLTGSLTLEAWIKPEIVTDWRTVLVKEQTGGLLYGLYSSSGSSSATPNLPTGIVFTGGAERAVSGGRQFVTSTWAHMALTFDGSTARLYLGGSLYGSRYAPGLVPVSGSPLRIGGNRIWGEYFKGVIDEVRVYNRVLTASEIQADMNTAITAAPTPAPTAPAAPTGLTVSGTTQSSISLAWNASSGAAGYGVYRDGTAVGSTTATAYTVTSLACGTTYTLAVDAYDAAGNRSTRTSATAATSACPTSTANLYVSPYGADTNACTQSAPCRSLDRAYDLASPGATVEIAGGTYGSQSLTGTKSAPAVVMRPAAGATVTLGSISVAADRVELRNVRSTGGLTVTGASDYATLRNLDLNGRLYVAGARDLAIIGGDVGPYVDNPSWVTHDNGTIPQRVLIEGVHFHDFSVSSSSVHTECMLVIAGDGLTFRGNKWTNCSIFDLSFGWCCSSPSSPRNVLIENNFFGRAISGAGTTLHFNTNLSPVNYTIRNNSAGGPFVLDQSQGTFSNVRAVGNAIPGGRCGRVAWSYNVFSGTGCAGTGNRTVANIGFVNAAAADFHLTATSPARDAGSPTDYPQYDYDGQARPVGAAPDAGADESG